MKSFEITNIKAFTSALFAKDTFDSFCVTDASFQTLFSVSIDGHVNKEFGGHTPPAQSASAGDTALVAEDTSYHAAGTGSDKQYGEQSSSYGDDVVTWGTVRNLCYEIIKGKSLPVRFKIVLMTPRERVGGFVRNHGLSCPPSDVNGLFMNIRYENGALTCVTGVSLKTFSLDKSLENAWDDSVAQFLARFS